jgi:3-methyladenine DNA glycosylase/8-oxoguanine DNA glycosylase
MYIEAAAGTIRSQAWGPGRGWLTAALPRLLGAEDEMETFRPPAGLVRQLARHYPGVRFGRTDAVLESLLPAVCEQKVTGAEAHRAWRGMVSRLGEAAPGPGRVRLAPLPEVLARTPYHALHPFGLEQRRADTIRRAAARAAWLEAAAALASTDALARLRAVPGVGPWTAAETARAAFGDADAVSMGDFHLPHLVSWALAGEPRGDDTRMLELLEPYRGHRARVVRLLELSGIRAPRYGPRLAPRSIATM